MHPVARWLLPAGVDAAAAPLLAARALRALMDGCVSVLLPSYLLALGLEPWKVGLLSTATMLGSAFTTLAVGALGHRFQMQHLLRAAALLMAATGAGFAACSSARDFWPLLAIAFIGTLNPSSGDVSVFLALEQASLAGSARGHARTALFARYSVVGGVFAAFGALLAGVPGGFAARFGVSQLDALRGLFVVYAACGVLTWWLYAGLGARQAHAPVDEEAPARAALGPSRGTVVRLAALFSIDAFAGGLILNSLLSLWLMERFGLSPAQSGAFFFATGLLSAASQLCAPWVAQRIGLLNTAVFTHIPSSVCLMLAALAPDVAVALSLLLVRSALSQMDVPVRAAFVMAVVTPAERTAAASFTAVPRSLAAALSPSLGGALFAAGWLAAPLLACGVLKIGYDLALWRAFRQSELEP
jgi:MFS family permease